MPYIRLNQANIKYSTDILDSLIVSDIVESGCSYQNPVLIRDKDSLDIYFGRSFHERDYYDELLKSGVTLFLYRPISTVKRTDLEDYIDMSEYVLDDTVYPEESNLPNEGAEGIIYLIGDGDEFIWISEGQYYANVENLQQNINGPENYVSWKNRDTLRILKNGSEEKKGFSYCYPKYPWDSEYSEEINEEVVFDSMQRGITGIENNYDTFSFTLDFTLVNNFYAPEEEKSYYFVVPSTENDLNYMIWYERNDLENEVAPVGGDFIGGNSVSIKLISDETGIAFSKQEIIQHTKELIISLGYNIDGNGDKFIIYSSRKGKNSYFYELPNLTIESNFNITHDILSIATEKLKRIEFYSKTIGPSDDNEDIKIKIEKIDYYEEKYRITVSRYNYSEIHEANLFSTPDLDGNISNLEGTINKNSKLITCKIFQYGYKPDGTRYKYYLGDPESSLPEGEWYLRRATKESFTPDMYWNSLKILKEQDIQEDFLLVPNINQYKKTKIPDTLDWFPEYEDLYEYSVQKNCQVLITNLDTGYTFNIVTSLPKNPQENIIYQLNVEDSISSYWTLIDGKLTDVSNDREIINPYLNNFIFNWTKDKDNRIVYFYKDMEVLTYQRPGYYIFLRGIISDIYSMSVQKILYNPPVSDPYLDNNSMEELLEEKKSNYLVDNNQLYYYKKYLNHPKDGIYNTTILTRFCISKLSREIMNNKWNILGTQMAGQQKEEIQKILNTLESRYSIIRNIIITSLDFDYENSSMKINLELYVSELLDKSINLSVTLNYIY